MAWPASCIMGEHSTLHFWIVQLLRHAAVKQGPLTASVRPGSVCCATCVLLGSLGRCRCRGQQHTCASHIGRAGTPLRLHDVHVRT